MGRFAVIGVLLAIFSAAIYLLFFAIYMVGLVLGAEVFNPAYLALLQLPFFVFIAVFLTDIFALKRFTSDAGVAYEDISGKGISVVMPAYNEEKAIQKVVKDFSSQKGVREVVVLDNGSADKTGQLARKAGARVVRIEPNRGLGYGSYLAMKNAKNGVIVLAESDSTHKGADMRKLLPYLENVDMVIGTRTTEEFINKGAKMDWFLRWGNLFIAKLLQIRFHNRYRLTDVGCLYRAIKSESFAKMESSMKVFNETFSLYMIIAALKSGLSIAEVPISYNERIGESKYIGKGRWFAFKLGLKMIWYVLAK